jgi:hypothetical protein
LTQLRERQLRYRPTDEDVAFFREHGWFVTPKIFSDEEIEEALVGVARQHAGERDVELPFDVIRRPDWKQGDPGGLRLNDYVALNNAHLRRFVESPQIGATAARLVGARQIRLWQSGIVYKEPHSEEEKVTIGWHTDGAYWQTCTSTQMLTAWIPLHDTDESMGTLVVVDGAHRWERTPEIAALLSGRTFLGTDPGELEARLESLGLPVERVPIVVERGQVSFHDRMMLHASGPNRSERPRIAITVDLQSGDNRYRPWPGADGFQHSNDRLCRKQPNGDPDYTDPFVFPVLWEEDVCIELEVIVLTVGGER